MTSAAESAHDPLAAARRLNAERSPKAVRDVLPSDRREVFEAQYRQALGEAARTYDLAPVHALVERWLGEAVLHVTETYFETMDTVEAVKRGDGPHGQIDVDHLRERSRCAS